MNALLNLWCRLFGRACSINRPASKDLVEEMKDRGRKAEAQTTEIRRARELGIPGAFFPARQEENHRAH